MSKVPLIAAIVAPVAVGLLILAGGVVVELTDGKRGSEGFQLVPSLLELLGAEQAESGRVESQPAVAASAPRSALETLAGIDTQVGFAAIAPVDLDPEGRSGAAAPSHGGSRVMPELMGSGDLSLVDGGHGAGYGPKARPAVPPTGYEEGGGEVDLRESIRRRVPTLRGCYERSIKDGSRIEGALRLRWTIRPDGSAADVRATRDTLRHEQLRACVLREVRGWRFAEGTAPVVVEYPLEFVRERR